MQASKTNFGKALKGDKSSDLLSSQDYSLREQDSRCFFNPFLQADIAQLSTS